MTLSVSYNKLWRLLTNKQMSKAELRRSADIAPNTFTKLNRNEEVSMVILKKICKCLQCNIGDICEFIEVSKGA